MRCDRKLTSARGRRVLSKADIGGGVKNVRFLWTFFMDGPLTGNVNKTFI